MKLEGFFEIILNKTLASGTILGQKFTIKSDSGDVSYTAYNDYTSWNCKAGDSIDKFKKITAGGKDIYCTYSGSTENPFPDYSVQNIMRRIEQNYLDNYFTPSTWARDSVQHAIDSNFVPKTLQRGYRRPITRAEFCKLATAFYENLKKTTITQRATFKDTTDVNVPKMAGLGVVSGVSQDNFAPNNILTREEAATILVRLANVINVPLQNGTANFSDNSNIANWAKSAVGTMQHSGIMGGTENNKFSPKTSYTREQSIVTIMKLASNQSEPTGIEISDSTLEMIPTGHTTISATVIPASSINDAQIRWSSSNTAVASVDEKTGTISAHKGGTATITATTSNGITAECKVSVMEPVDQFCIKLPFEVSNDRGKLTITNITVNNSNISLDTKIITLHRKWDGDVDKTLPTYLAINPLTGKSKTVLPTSRLYYKIMDANNNLITKDILNPQQDYAEQTSYTIEFIPEKDKTYYIDLVPVT